MKLSVFFRQTFLLYIFIYLRHVIRKGNKIKKNERKVILKLKIEKKHFFLYLFCFHVNLIFFSFSFNFITFTYIVNIFLNWTLEEQRRISITAIQLFWNDKNISHVSVWAVKRWKMCNLGSLYEWKFSIESFILVIIYSNKIFIISVFIIQYTYNKLYIHT